MGLLEVVFGKPQLAQIGVVTLDASIEETHTVASEVTEHPVEEGVSISDHIRRLPETLEINGVVTNHPIFLLPSITAPSPIGGDTAAQSDRVKAAYDQLRKIHDDGDLIKVITSLREYENMVITGFSTIRNAPNGNVMNATISLREVLTAKTETTQAPTPVNSAASATQDQGKKTTKAADDAVTERVDQSLAASGFDALTGLFQ